MYDPNKPSVRRFIGHAKILGVEVALSADSVDPTRCRLAVGENVEHVGYVRFGAAWVELQLVKGWKRFGLRKFSAGRAQVKALLTEITDRERLATERRAGALAWQRADEERIAAERAHRDAMRTAAVDLQARFDDMLVERGIVGKSVGFRVVGGGPAIMSHVPATAPTEANLSVDMPLALADAARLLDLLVEHGFVRSIRPPPFKASVGEVALFTKILDGGRIVRCTGCHHPARVVPERESSCAVCGRSLAGAPTTTAQVYKASRADDAPVPYVEGAAVTGASDGN